MRYTMIIDGRVYSTAQHIKFLKDSAEEDFFSLPWCKETFTSAYIMDGNTVIQSRLNWGSDTGWQKRKFKDPALIEVRRVASL
mgnify:CR=1 FL=1